MSPKIEALVPQDGFEEVATGEDGDLTGEVSEEVGVRIAQFDKNSGVRVKFTNTRNSVDRFEVGVLKPNVGENENKSGGGDVRLFEGGGADGHAAHE